MTDPSDSLCEYLPEEGRYETMAELAIALKRERNDLPSRRERLFDAKEAARLERWIKRKPKTEEPPKPFIPPPPTAKPPEPVSLLEQLVEKYRVQVVQAVIVANHGNQGIAAKVLGVHRNTVNRIVVSAKRRRS